MPISNTNRDNEPPNRASPVNVQNGYLRVPENFISDRFIANYHSTLSGLVDTDDDESTPDPQELPIISPRQGDSHMPEEIRRFFAERGITPNSEDDPAEGFDEDERPIYCYDSDDGPVNNYQDYIEILANRVMNDPQQYRPHPTAEAHFDDRQRQRHDREAREIQTRRGLVEQQAWAVIDEINRGRRAESQFNVMCDYCLKGKNSQRDNIVSRNGQIICNDCFRTNFNRCSICNNYESRTAMAHTANPSHSICNNCADTSDLCAHCRDCDRVILRAHGFNDNNALLCESCYEDLSTPNIDPNMEVNDYEPQWRHYSERKLKAYCSSDNGSIIKSPRIFSAELETKYPNAKSLNELMTFDFPRHLGAEYDGSISANGAEFQTPKLQGKNGEEFINKLSTALTARNFKTDKTTGLHIHLDGGENFIAKSLDSREQHGLRLKNLFLFYILFEDVIHSFLPLSRRINGFCRPIKDSFHIDEIRHAQSLDDLEKIWYRTRSRADVASSKREKKHGSRYCGVNLHTLLSDNHLEIRYHSGTINAKKILEWVNLHATIMDRVANEGITLSKLENVRGLLSLEDKTKAFFDLIALPVTSKKYFERRQAKFMAEPKDEEDTLTANL